MAPFYVWKDEPQGSCIPMRDGTSDAEVYALENERFDC
jgi:hypothetical protein